MWSLSRRPALLLVAGILPLIAGCEWLGIQSPDSIAAAREAEGRAIGGACRHAGRAIEDCYQLNRRADKAAVFAGWREMNDYMRENRLDEVRPQLAPAGGGTAGSAAPAGAVGGGKEAASKGAGSRGV